MKKYIHPSWLKKHACLKDIRMLKIGQCFYGRYTGNLYKLYKKDSEIFYAFSPSGITSFSLCFDNYVLKPAEVDEMGLDFL